MKSEIGLAVFIVTIISALLILLLDISYQSVQKQNEAIMGMVKIGINPITARCSIDYGYSKDNAALCSEAMKKDSK